MDIVEKKCGRCQQMLPVSEFGKNASTPDGLTCYCKSCKNEYGRDYISVTGKGAGYHRKRRYGITQDEFEEMVADTSGYCPICGDVVEKWHVDHNHTTGEVRNVLCFNCNAGLGKFKDDPKILAKALEYLESFQ